MGEASGRFSIGSRQSGKSRPGAERPSARRVPGRGVARGGERSPLPVAGASTGRPPWAPRPPIPGWHLQSRDPRPRLLQSPEPQRPRRATPSPELAGRGGSAATTLPSQDLPTSSLSGPVTPGLWPTALACALPEFRISGIRVSMATGQRRHVIAPVF